MSLSPIIGAASQVLSLFGSQSSSSNTASSTSPDPSSIQDSSGNVNLSQAAQFFSKLQDLSQTNPSQFKKLTAEISSQLQTDAQKATTTGSQTFLNNLAGQFQAASQTGSTTPLQTASFQTGSLQTASLQTASLQTASLQTGGHHGHGHHSSTGEAAYSQASQSAATDSQDSTQSYAQSIFQQLQSL
jgi:hypothetical protein